MDVGSLGRPSVLQETSFIFSVNDSTRYDSCTAFRPSCSFSSTFSVKPNMYL